jgi:hypothetical protein
LNYDNRPLGIYNKMPYLLDYILEIIRFPGREINLFKISIHHLEVNKAYPLSKIIFAKRNEKLFLEEFDNNRKIEMFPETFARFKKIRVYYDSKNKKTKKNEDKKEPKKKELSEEEIKKLEEEKDRIDKEKKEAIHKINLMKKETKLLNNWLSKFNTDLELYRRFLKEELENDDFVLPEMFEDKHEFFSEIKEEDLDSSFTLYFEKFNPDCELDMSLITDLLEDDSVDSSVDSSDNESISSVDSDDSNHVDDDKVKED